MNTMRSEVRIEYNGVDATETLAGENNSFTWKDNATGTADTVTLELSNSDGKWLNGFFPSDRDTFKAWIGVHDWAADYKEGNLFCGTFYVDSLQFSGYPERLQLSGISGPIRNNFSVKQKNRSYSKTTLATILGDLAREAGLELVYDAEDIMIESISQNGKTDQNWAYSLCSQYGLGMKLYNSKIVAYDQTRYEAKAALYTITKQQLGGGGAYSISRQVTAVYDSVKMQYMDDKQSDPIEYTFTVPGKPGERQMFLTQKAESYADAERQAKAALRKNMREAVKITLKMMGSAKYMAADCFSLEGFGQLDGKYFVDGVTHQRAGGKYTTSLTAHLAVEGW